MNAHAKHVIDFDHHGPELRDHNAEVVQRLVNQEAGCPMGWSTAHDGFWAIWGYQALYDAVQDWELFSSGHSPELPKGVPPAAYEAPLIPIDYDGPLQQDFRKVVLNWFNPGPRQAASAAHRADLRPTDRRFHRARARRSERRAVHGSAGDRDAGDARLGVGSLA